MRADAGPAVGAAVEEGAVDEPGGRPPDRRDLAAVLCAAGAWAGAASPLRPTLPQAAALLAVLAAAAVVRFPRTALVVALAVVASVAAGRSEAGLVPPEPGPFTGQVTLVDDPEELPGLVRADVRAAGRRYELRATGGAAGTVGRAAAGERLVVTEGRLGPARGHAGHLRSRHVAGRIDAHVVEPGGAPAPAWGLANAVRGRVAAGTAALPEANAALTAGLVFGDDRALPPAHEHDLRAAGLAHLTAVSGQNVAFLLVIAAPALARLQLAGRFVAVLALLGVFLVMTRVEPSVLRASAMAAVATAGTTLGRPVPGVRLLALSVTGLVLVDPMLVHSLGFLLSVAATGGIVVGAERVASALPLPRWCALPIGVTVAAQLAVAPVLVAAGLRLPVVAVLANPLAGPAAGWTMAWGLTAGWVAGWSPPWLAGVLHLPTRVSTGIVLEVARRSAALPVGSVRPGHLVGIGVGLALLAVGAVHRRRRAGTASPERPGRRTGAWAWAGWAVLAGSVVAEALPQEPPQGRYEVATGAEVGVAGPRRVLVLDGRADPLRVLDALDDVAVRRLDLLVVCSAGPRVAGTARVVTSRVPTARVVVPAGAVAAGEAVREPQRVTLPTGDLVVRPAAGRLAVEGGALR